MQTSKKGARVRAAAAETVDAVVSSGRSLDDALAAFEKRIAPDDRPLLRMLCFGCVRHHWRLQGWIDELLDRPLKKRDSVIRALLAVGLFQLIETRIPDHAAVSQTVEAARLLRQPKYAGLLNAILRRFMREQMSEQPPASDPARYDHPEWLIAAIRRDWPDDWEGILATNNERAPMWLRVNRRRGSRESYQQRLQAASIRASSMPGLDQALRLHEPAPVIELPGFAAGDVSVQDAAAQIAAPWLLGNCSGRLLDACAAPGGKSAHLLELGAGGDALTCIDIDPGRLQSVNENLRRLDLTATVRAGDASKPGEWWDKKPFDGILLDAPCSASGVIRRHPDIKLLRRATDIDVLARRQGEILSALWPLLAPGGRLLYVTCSVLADENDAVVGAFLDACEDAREDDMLQNNNIRDVMRRKTFGYQILPGTAAMDGFYYACLVKTP
ncbi:MAG: 16S rRNA (cytosine(967)-C(5))-methyltransferase RsmB [Gammaproteobacteria bacterium]|nr:16S rRNA (cytosine(967)-C(5))-methyltransferase RsmB [Gammaproteobacteria bacterium]